MEFAPQAIGPLYFYAQKILPAVFDDSLSYYEVVARSVKKLNEVIESDNSQSEAIAQLVKLSNQLQTLLESIKNGEYADLYIDQLAKWIDDNLQALVARLAYFAFPGLEEFPDGSWHFTMTVPKSWAFLKFTFPFADDGTYHVALNY